MAEAATKKKIAELLDIITLFSGSRQSAPAEGTYESYLNNVKLSLDETIDHLRVQLKYLLFDLEATRRENRYLRQMLENRPPNER